MEENTRLYKQGDVIFEEGSFEMWMYVLRKGTVGIYAHYGKEDEKLLTQVRAKQGATFGEMGLLDSMRRSATAVAMEEVEVCIVNGENFADYFGNDPEALLDMMRSMSVRIRRLTNDYMEVCKVIAEAVEDTGEKKTKSGWLSRVGRFVGDYAEAMTNACSSGWIYLPFGSNK